MCCINLKLMGRLLSRARFKLEREAQPKRESAWWHGKVS